MLFDIILNVKGKNEIQIFNDDNNNWIKYEDNPSQGKSLKNVSTVS